MSQSLDADSWRVEMPQATGMFCITESQGRVTIEHRGADGAALVVYDDDAVGFWATITWLQRAAGRDHDHRLLMTLMPELATSAGPSAPGHAR